jgi:hypothetical protein
LESFEEVLLLYVVQVSFLPLLKSSVHQEFSDDGILLADMQNR